MALKGIVLDVDGTLLTSQKNISAKTKKTLIDAQREGITVILASGRPTNAMRRIANELKMGTYEGYIISYNGGAVFNCRTGEQLLNQTLSVEKAKAILEHLKSFQVIPMINDEEYMYVNDVYRNRISLEDGAEINIIEYESRGGNFNLCEKRDLAKFLDFPLNKILVAGQPDYLANHHDDLYRPFKETTTAAFSAPFYYEFTDKDIDKSKALAKICERIGASPEELIAFGDSYNDRSIIEFAGIGIAMGNAVAKIKEVAQTETLSNDEDGIAVALKRFL